MIVHQRHTDHTHGLRSRCSKLIADAGVFFPTKMDWIARWRSLHVLALLDCPLQRQWRRSWRKPKGISFKLPCRSRCLAQQWQQFDHGKSRVFIMLKPPKPGCFRHPKRGFWCLTGCLRLWKAFCLLSGSIPPSSGPVQKGFLWPSVTPRCIAGSDLFKLFINLTEQDRSAPKTADEAQELQVNFEERLKEAEPMGTHLKPKTRRGFEGTWDACKYFCGGYRFKIIFAIVVECWVVLGWFGGESLTDFAFGCSIPSVSWSMRKECLLAKDFHWDHVNELPSGKPSKSIQAAQTKPALPTSGANLWQVQEQRAKHEKELQAVDSADLNWPTAVLNWPGKPAEGPCW